MSFVSLAWSSECHARDSQVVGGQPGRDRDPGVPVGQRAGHPDRGDLLARGPVRDAPAQGRRGVPVGKPGEPLRSYLNIEAIVELAVEKGVDAIHPGYGFLSENADFARACEKAGIIFVGPRPELLDQLGDKVAARRLAQAANVPVLGGSDDPVLSGPEAHGWPRSSATRHRQGVDGRRRAGDAGRPAEDGLDDAIDQARREAGTAFGVPDVFLEKFIERARHIEVQILGDKHGHLVHLFERDCSIQRRHQKVIEIAPAPNLDPAIREELCDSAVRLASSVGYDNAGTVEFLYDADASRFYFIEVNPRIQVEHTVTEMVTGVDLIKSQILISAGGRTRRPRDQPPRAGRRRHPGVRLPVPGHDRGPREQVHPRLRQDHPLPLARRPGLRLDGGLAITGAIITPFYDSLLVKVCASGRRFVDAARRMERALREFRVRGVKTNVPFLLNVIRIPTSSKGGRRPGSSTTRPTCSASR